MIGISIVFNLLLWCQAIPVNTNTRWWTVVNDNKKYESPSLFHDVKVNCPDNKENMKHEMIGTTRIEKTSSEKSTEPGIVINTPNTIIINNITKTFIHIPSNDTTTTKEDVIDAMNRIGTAALASLAG